MVQRDKYEANDTTKFDESKLQDLQTIKHFLLHAKFGSNVRAPMAQLPDAIFKALQDGVDLGTLGALAELIVARGQFESLGIHESAQDNEIQNNAAAIVNAIQKTENAVKLAQSAASGSPRGVFDNVSELKDAYPKGQGGIYVTKDTGHWWYWTGLAWSDGGQWQGPLTPDLAKLEDREMLNQLNLEIVDGQRLGGAKEDGTINIYPVSDSSYTVMNVANILGETLVVPMTNFTKAQFLILTDENDNVIQNYSYKQLNGLQSGDKDSASLARFFAIKGKYVYIFIQTMKSYLGFKKIYLGFPNAVKPNIYYSKSIDLERYAPWLKDEQPSLISKKVYAQTSKKYDVNTKLPVFEKYNGTNVWYFDLKEHKEGTLTIPAPRLVPNNDGTYPVTQMLYRLDSNGQVFENMGYSTDTGYPNVKESNYLIYKDNKLIFDLAKINAAQLILVVPSNYISYFYEKYEGVFGINEINPSVKLESKTLDDKEFNLPLMVPVTSGEDQYIYFDSLIRRKNIYNNEVTASSKNMLDDHAIINASSDGSAMITFNQNKDVRIPYKVVPKKISGDYKLLVIGESTSEADAYMTGLRDYLADSGASFTLLGSRSTSINKVPMEAYSGWGAGTLRYMAEANNRKNEFYNPTTQVFDYNYYLSQHSGQSAPDICLINFGINPTNRYTDPAKTTSSSQNIQYIIDQIKTAKSDCKFVIGLTHYCSRWSNYWADTSARREEILQGVSDLIRDFGNRESENIYLNPMFASLDPRWDMQYEEVAANRNDARKSYRGLDNHHPSSIGYKNNAYSTVNAIKYAILN